ncbi:MAG: hypothetical protein H0T62_02325 [Parachlamydiaceae bacterium]|nr:hypothetical protein [Parachlamydiaceae bacterium]
MLNLQDFYRNELDRIRENINSNFAFEGIDEIIPLIEKYAYYNHEHYFSYIVYRISQAVCSIFGYSDWQIARNRLVFKLNSENFEMSEWFTGNLNHNQAREKVDIMLELMVNYYRTNYKNCNEDNHGHFSVDHDFLVEDLQNALKLIKQKFTAPQVLSQGIPNDRLTTCYANAAAMALYPIRHILLQTQNVPVCKSILEVYNDPVNHASKMVEAFNDCMKETSGLISQDVSSCLFDTFESITKKNPELESVLMLTHYKNDRKVSLVGLELDGNKKTLSEAITSNLDRGFNNLKLGKYLLLHVRDLPGMTLDTEEFFWKDYKLKLLSASTGGTGHSTTYIEVNNVWTHFNDNRVNISSPIGKSGFAAILIETTAEEDIL